MRSEFERDDRQRHVEARRDIGIYNRRPTKFEAVVGTLVIHTHVVEAISAMAARSMVDAMDWKALMLEIFGEVAIDRRQRSSERHVWSSRGRNGIVFANIPTVRLLSAVLRLATGTPKITSDFP